MKQVYIEFAMRVMHWREKAGVFCGFTLLPSVWSALHPNVRLLGPIYDMCAPIPYQGQGQRSKSRSLPSKIVKTLLVRTKCFCFLKTCMLNLEAV